MIFCGDFAFPFDKSMLLGKDCTTTFLKKDKVVNFESTLNTLNKEKTASGIALSSTDLAFKEMKALNVKGVTLANNHILDFDYDINKFLLKFKLAGINKTGLGNDLEESSVPMKIGDFLIFNFGWETIGCKPASETSKGCNPLNYKHIKTLISNAKSSNVKQKIVVVFHWNYEFELYPQPSHRKLAKELIDIGVDAVIGHHSHIIQGAELYKGKPIIYGLGNFYLPKFNYSGYYLDFPDDAYTGLAVDISNLDSYLVYSHNNEFRVSEPVPLFDNEKVMKVSQFSGMSDADYLSFFKEHRVKRKLLPIYNKWGLQTHVNDKLVQYRQIVIDALVRLNLKKHNK